jgi:hypothetical protein
MVIFGWVLLPFSVYAISVPPLINYQGRLTDAQGKGLTAEKMLEFNIYDQAVGGEPVWGPQVFDKIFLVDGYFNVILGTTDSNGKSIADAFSSEKRFLGIKVTEPGGAFESVPEISPRQQILSAPFSIRAGNGSPVGAVHSYVGKTDPPGWLLCDGRAVSRAEYKELFELVGTFYGDGDGLTTFNIPDYRGMFLRGADDPDEDGEMSAAGRDPDTASRIRPFDDETAGGVIGSIQLDSMQSHKHLDRGHSHIIAEGTKKHFNTGHTFGIRVASGGRTETGKADLGDPVDSESGAGEVRHGNETRPINIYVNYIVKY